HWMANIRSLTSDLSEAVSKRAVYGGDVYGTITDLTRQNQTAVGAFSAKVQFNTHAYTIKNFSFAFDGVKYNENNSGQLTANNKNFKIDVQKDSRNLYTSGYFIGRPQLKGAPPPGMGGDFAIKGPSYNAGGIFIGNRKNVNDSR
ncbi:MAG: hypothetical protein CMM47_07495, partial [Rhodospirillaceae bacterium]|nr:hypothetical protein [Rhodospirillaceae bacterium]